MTFSNNNANTYGPDIAGLARELIKFDDEDQYLQYLNQEGTGRFDLIERDKFYNDFLFTGVQSGGNVPTVFFGLIDSYG